jgi:hypothetical protein
MRYALLYARLSVRAASSLFAGCVILRTRKSALRKIAHLACASACPRDFTHPAEGCVAEMAP